MTWGEFTGAIAKAKFTNRSQAKTLEDIFIAAGRMVEFSEESAKKWISGVRKCKVDTYFPMGKIVNEDVYKYFRNRPEASLRALQAAFDNIETDSIVNCKTDDMDVFCKSLLNQFLALLGFQLLDDEPIRGNMKDNNLSHLDSPPSSSDHTILIQIKTPSEQMKEIFVQAAKDCRIVVDMLTGTVEIAGLPVSGAIAGASPRSLFPNMLPVFNESLDVPELRLNINRFLEVIESEIGNSFDENKNEAVYNKIMEFTNGLRSYDDLLKQIESSSNNSDTKSLSTSRQRLTQLYADLVNS